jgi:hypothetical protein
LAEGCQINKKYKNETISVTASIVQCKRKSDNVLSNWASISFSRMDLRKNSIKIQLWAIRLDDAVY